MAGRQPFNLRKILIVYNFFQTIFSAWIFYEVRVTRLLLGFFDDAKV